MPITVKYHDAAENSMEVDLARFDYNKDSLFIDFAKVISSDEENDDIGEIEVRSRIIMPIESALANLAGFVHVLIEYENEHRTGYGLAMPKPDNEE